jgi:hypothetical protein
MTLFSRLGVVSVMAAPSRLNLVAFATSKSARFGAAQPYLFVRKILYVIRPCSVT